MRRALVQRVASALHRWIGLAVGALFVLLGLTGSVLVFYLEIDEAASTPVRRADHPVAVQQVIERLRARHPDRAGPWRIEMPLEPGRPLRARYYNPVETADRMFAPLLVTLDPATLAVIDERFWGRGVLTWIYNLHYTLLLERTGHTLVGIVGLLMLASLATGLSLWWVARRRRWRAWRPSLRHGAVRRTYDLHLLIGLYGWIALTALALTGAALALPNIARNIVSLGHPPPALEAPAPAGPIAPIRLDQAIAIAHQHFPAGEPRWIHTSGRNGEAIVVRLYQPGEPSRRFPQTMIWLHAGTGAVLRVQDGQHRSGSEKVLAWMHPIHNGEAFGMAGRIVACLAGLLPLIAMVTGWMRHRHKRVARSVRKRCLTG